MSISNKNCSFSVTLYKRGQVRDKQHYKNIRTALITLCQETVTLSNKQLPNRPLQFHSMVREKRPTDWSPNYLEWRPPPFKSDFKKRPPSCLNQKFMVTSKRLNLKRSDDWYSQDGYKTHPLEHSGMTEPVEPLRRAATVSLWATWSEPRSKTLEHSRITQLLRRAATGHKLTLAVPRSSSAILGCSNTFMHASRWLRTCPKLSHRRWVT